MNVNKAFSLMNKNRSDNKKKGDAGEKISLALVQQYLKNREGCTILHSYKYAYPEDVYGNVVKGNIKYEDGKYKCIQKNGFLDEIDLVVITEYRIFAIEVKARGGTWTIFDHWAKQNSKMVDKSPITQAEKHARCLYGIIHEYLPGGNPDYIIPLVVYVDKAKIKDTRSKEFKKYVNICIANKFVSKLRELETPLKYDIDKEELIEYMLNVGECDVYK